MKVTIGIVTKNRTKSLRQTLTSISKGIQKPYEILIVENLHKKTLGTILDKFNNLNIRYFSGKKPGIAYCRNIILKKSEGDLIAFIDDDCILPANWLKKVCSVFKKEKRLAAVMGKSLNYYRKNPIAGLEQDLYIVWLSQYINPDKKSELKSGMFVNTRNFIIKKDFIIKSGLKFNPETPFKIEDTDFGLRLFKILKIKKLRLLYNPEIYIYHKNSTNIIDFLKRYGLSKTGSRWLNLKYPGFEDAIIRDKSVYAKLGKKKYSGVASLLQRRIF